MPRNHRQHSFDEFSDQEKEKLNTVKKELAEAQKRNLKTCVNIYRLLTMV